ncbi:MAG: LysM peptidoglycan-binding domain-containing protein [Dorea sp.]|jgi:hypothetical protein|nr:LysM peptidoglycan-binding domain-containing protein [Dorea sp.]MCI9248439.1 LysM peptidoglycan-binding domain-containing protein [Dorea sp.]
MRKRQFYLARKYALILLAVIIATGAAVSLNGISAKAGDLPAEDASSCAYLQIKSYKSMRLEPGDTLWGIALEHKGSRYASAQDYIDEVMEINGLTSDRIHADRYLTIPYYE